MSVASLVRRAAVVPVQVATVALAVPALVYEGGRHVVIDAGTTLERGRLLVQRAVLLLEAVEILVAEISDTADRAAAVAALADSVAVSAAGSVVTVDAELRRTGLLLDAYAPLLSDLRPVADRAAHSVHPRHVEAITQLLDLTPDVLELITPALRNLGDLTPELAHLTARFEAIGQIVEGIPGAGLLRRRGSDDDESATTADEHDADRPAHRA